MFPGWGAVPYRPRTAPHHGRLGSVDDLPVDDISVDDSSEVWLNYTIQGTARHDDHTGCGSERGKLGERQCVCRTFRAFPRFLRRPSSHGGFPKGQAFVHVLDYTHSKNNTWYIFVDVDFEAATTRSELNAASRETPHVPGVR